MRGLVRTISFFLAAATGLAVHGNAALGDAGPCHSMQYERAAYTICEVDLRRHTVRLYWNRPDGTPYAYLSAFAIRGDTLLHWTPDGYDARLPRPRRVAVDVLTPPAIIGVLSAGYETRWHRSATD
jgi:hypothetical protein